MNSQSFTPEEVEQGLHLDFLNTLLDYNQKAKDHYNDIHITTDGCCIIIEWECLSYDYDRGLGFKFIGEEQVIMLEKQMPDRTYRLFHNEEDYEEALKEEQYKGEN